MPRKKQCRICHSLTAPLRPDGRCDGCYAAKDADSRGLHYGDYIALRDAGLILPDPLPPRPVEVPEEPELIVYRRKPPCRQCGGEIPQESKRRAFCSEKCYRAYCHTHYANGKRREV